MSNIIPFQPNQLPAMFQGIAMDDSALSDNVGAGYAVVSIKGKVFSIKHGGNTVPMMINYQGQQFPAPYFDVVLAKANPNLSKTYYKDQFTEGSSEGPDCWSEDGVHPLAVPPISPDCRMCPMNQQGSKVSDSGARLKACADTRKVAVVPADNIDNERFDGAMLLRIPAASLGGLADYDRMLKSNGVPFYAVVTRVSFDSTVAYPKLVFTPLRVLTEEEATKIVGLRKDVRVDAVVNAPQPSSPQTPGAGLGAAIAQDAAPQPAPFFAPPAAAPAPQQVMQAPAAVQAPPPVFAPPAAAQVASVPNGLPPGFPGTATAPPPTFLTQPPAAFNPGTGEITAPVGPPTTVAPTNPPPTGAVDPAFLANLQTLLNS